VPGSSNAWEYLRDRFGVERNEVAGELVMQSGDAWLSSSGTDCETPGVRFVRFTGIGPKPTTYALQLLGDAVDRNRVELSEQELNQLLDGDMVDRYAESKGYVALVFRGRIAGCGLYRDGVVSSKIPKSRSAQLASIFSGQSRDNR
jgi:NOL1/NOP2/fmu family ribosome biogenesis protein